jgi:hypothetical protein
MKHTFFTTALLLALLGCETASSGPETCPDHPVWEKYGTHWVINDCCDGEITQVGRAPEGEPWVFWDTRNCGGCGIECENYCQCEWVDYSSGTLLDCFCGGENE